MPNARFSREEQLIKSANGYRFQFSLKLLFLAVLLSATVIIVGMHIAARAKRHLEIRQLLTLCGSPDPRNRDYALARIGEMGPSAMVAIPGLLDLGRTMYDPMACYATYDSPYSIGHPTPFSVIALFGEPAIPCLTEELQSHQRYIRLGAIYALHELGSQAVTAVPALVTQFGDDSNEDGRVLTLWALESIGYTDRSVRELLVRALRDRSWRVRCKAARTIASFGPRVREIEPALIIALQEVNRDDITAGYLLAEDIIRALGAVESDAAVPILREHIVRRRRTLESEVETTAAIEALGRIGRGADCCVPVLLELYRRQGRDVVYWGTAAEALSNIAPSEKRHISYLQEALQHSDSRVRYWATRTLEHIGVHPAEASEGIGK